MKKNGFTLIELLAVLAILAILALLITPTVFDSINKFKNDSYNKQINMIESAAGDWASDKLKQLTRGAHYITLGNLKAEGYINKNLKNPVTNKNFPNDSMIKIEYNGKAYKVSYTKGSGTSSENSNLENNGPRLKLLGNYIVKNELGEVFTDPGVTAYSSSGSNITGSVIKTIKKDNITTVSSINASLKGRYVIYYKIINNGISHTIARNVVIGGSDRLIYPVGTEVYYNPETNTQCPALELNTAANAKTGCLKWNVVTVGDTASSLSVDIMLDHNSTGKIAWISKEDYIAVGGTESDWNNDKKNDKGPLTATEHLQVDTTTWDTSIKSSARLITGQEIANIGKDTVWNDGKFTDTKYTSQPWLYDNLSSSSTPEKPDGYWTSTAYSSNTYFSWNMRFNGSLDTIFVDNVDYFGVRPVITIYKSVI